MPAVPGGPATPLARVHLLRHNEIVPRT
jgi:hypothetical protein